MEEIVRKHFKKLRRIDKIQEIIANIKAVISDHVKPSFLFDICGSDRNTLSAFVTETNSQCLIIMEIKVSRTGFQITFMEIEVCTSKF